MTTTLNDGDRVIIWGDSSQLKLKLAEVEEIDKNITAGTAGFAGKHQIDVPHPRSPSSSDGDFVGFVGSGAMFAAGDLRE